MKIETLRFIDDLLKDKHKATYSEYAEAREQYLALGDDPPAALQAEVSAKRTILRQELTRIEDAIEDFAEHDWK